MTDSPLILDGRDGPLPVNYQALSLPLLMEAARAGDEAAKAEIERRAAALP